jgi:predicted nuclease of restriction endonuclease-like RecB superfamily
MKQGRLKNVADRKGQRIVRPQRLDAKPTGYNGTNYKSKMEADYASFLSTVCKGISFEYEPEVFYFPYGVSRTGVNGYIPDFKITDGKNTWYIEVKGYMDVRSAEKIRLFKKHYPGLRLYVVTPTEMTRIKKLYNIHIR